MRVYFDFEFIEDGAAFVMEPISLGMVKEDGEQLYIEFDDVDWSKANSWVMENVKPYLYGNGSIYTKRAAKESIINFCGDEPEFWAYFASYDWVLLCQLFGRMLDLPKGWPKWCRDLKQVMWQAGLSKEDIPVVNKDEHNALADAIWNWQTHLWIQNNV